MSEEEFARLKADIEQHGQQEQIVIWKGQLVDGRHRLRACQELGFEPDIWELNDDADPIAFVLSANLHRRHLSESQRALVAARLKGHYAEGAKQRQRAAGGDRKKSLPENLPEANGKGNSRDQAGAVLNVSGRSVDTAARLLAQAAPEVVETVERGELSLHAAGRLVEAVPSKREQAKLVKQGRSAIAAAVKQHAPQKPPASNSTQSQPARNGSAGSLVGRVTALLPDKGDEALVAAIETWLEAQDERPAVERFRSLWKSADAAGQAAIRALVLEQDEDDRRPVEGSSLWEVEA